MTELQDKLADLEATLDVKETEVRDSTAEAEKWKITAEALEKKLQAAEDLNKSLKEEIERLKVEQPSYSGESVLWKTKYLKLDHMKTVVLAVRGITSDVDAASTDKNDEIAKKRAKLKSKVSATANNLITASKNFASAGGLSPVSLVDAAASHLTAAVVDLLHTVKIRPTPPGELGDDDDGALEPLQSNGYFNIAETLRRRSAVESVYSALSTPPETRNVSMQAGRPRSGSNYLNGAGLGIQSTYGPSQEEADLEDLKMYLEDQTDGLVHSITSLVDAIRNNEAMPTIQNHITTIAGTIENVVTSVERTSSELSSYQALLVEKSQPIVSILQDCREKLLQASTASAGYDGSQPSKEFTQKLPPLAFQVARETKELVSRIMAIEAGRGEEDFS